MVDRWIVRALLAVCVTAGVCVSADVPAEAQQAPGDGPAKPAARSKAVAKPAEPQAADGEGDAGTPAPAAKKKRDPAEAARTVDAGIKLLQAGKTDQAVATLSSVIAGGNRPADISRSRTGGVVRREKALVRILQDFTGIGINRLEAPRCNSLR